MPGVALLFLCWTVSAGEALHLQSERKAASPKYPDVAQSPAESGESVSGAVRL